jgi:[protein-PII] uridylyltransferase
VVGERGGWDFVEAKLAERDTRHKQAGESRYLVEPNIKDGKGGLRDLQSLFWIAKYVYRVEDTAELVRLGLFNPDEHRIFEKAHRFLWTVRCHLHFLTGRAEERLSFDVQREMAKRLGYTNRGGLTDVERFMKHYFIVAKDVGDLTRIFCAALEMQNKKHRRSLGRFLPVLGRRREIGDFVAEGGRLDVARPNVFDKDPVNLLRLFHVAIENELDVHPNALKLVTRSLTLIDQKLRHDKEANRLFLEVLASRKDPERGLRAMNEARVLGRFVPDFGRIVAQMQFNMYHHYTVDEHLIRAVGFLSRIERGAFATEDPLTHDLFKHVKNRAGLYVAILLHDIAKGADGDHSDVGSDIARKLCPRLGLSPAETELVIWLVKHHLVMSNVAQTRDVNDPKTVLDFGERVQSPERLRLLLLLTVADIRAVGPGVWNGWKGQLLRELYYETEAVLQGGHAGVTYVDRVAEAKRALQERLVDVPRMMSAILLDRHYPAYWLSLDAATHEEHARLMIEADASGRTLTVLSEPNAKTGSTEVTVYTPDHPGLFSQLAGAFAMCGASIVDAKIFTTTHGMALDLFTIQNAEGGPFDDKPRLERLARAIESTLKGDVRAHEVIAQKRPRRRAEAFTVEPAVIIDNTASETHTVVEDNGRDRPGLLHDVTRALFNLSLSISSARIATYGERVVDVFYVKDAYGLKVIAPGKLKQIEENLLAALEGQLPRPARKRVALPAE